MKLISSAIKSGNKRKSIILLCGLFLQAFLTITPAHAASQETTTTILADQSVIGSGDVIRFMVWTYSLYDPVSFGQIQVTDTLTNETTESTLINGFVEINWSVPSPLIRTLSVLFIRSTRPSMALDIFP